jgi:hypothetical protein
VAVTFPDSVSNRVTSVAENPATNDLSHTVTSGTTLLLCFVAANASESASGITWNGQAMTEVSKVDATSNVSGDAGGSLWALVSPTPATGNFEVTSNSGSWGSWHIKAGLNVHGTKISSVSDAISELSNDENTSATNTNVHASGGSSGNKLLFFGVGIGDDMVPASNDASFTELAEINSAGGAGNNADGCVYICEGDAPSAITVTWGATDENAGSLYQIVAANDVNVSASTETLTVATPQASVALDVDVQASTASLTLAEQQASIANDVNVTTNVEALTLAEQQASIAVDVDVSASTSALTLQEQQASIAVDVDVATSLAELTIATHQATVTEGEVEETPAKSKGGRKRKRYIVEIDNQFIEVASVADAQAVLEQAREVAEDAATQLTEPVKDIPRISVKLISGKETKSKVLRRDVKKTQQAVEWIYRKAQQRIDRDREISRLLQAKIREEDEEEEALIALLM